MSFVQRVQMESLKNHLFFATLTYNQDMIPRITTSSGYTIMYADIHDLQNCFKRLRKDNVFGRPFRYFAVSERGSEGGRPHFHILFIIPKYDGDTFGDILSLESYMFTGLLKYWTRNIARRRNLSGKMVPDNVHPKYIDLCTYKRKFVRGQLNTNYDLHYLNPVNSPNGVADCAFYVLKYMLKPSDKETRLQQALHLNLGEDEYNDVWSLCRSRYIKSLGFGLSPCSKDGVSVPDPDIIDYLKKGVQRSKGAFPYPCFYVPDVGNTFPLSRYYRGLGDIFSIDDAYYFFYKNDSKFDDGSFECSDIDYNQLMSGIRRFEKIRSDIDFSHIDLDFD